MAREKKQTSEIDALKLQLAAYESVFAEVQHFTDLIRRQDGEVGKANTAMLEAREKYDAAKAELNDAKEARDGTKHALFMFLRPGPTEILPLFDRMEPADEEKHGTGSTQWRQEPVTALRLSLMATNLLTAADLIFVGQLQDKIQEDPDAWWEQIEALTAAQAAAIADKLADFIKEHCK
jgi:hypothetical protein